MRILIATDAWHPQVNGVVRTLTSLARSAAALDADINFLTPEGFPSVGVPTYPGLRMALPNRARDRAPDRAGRARSHSYRDRRADRLGGARLLPPQQAGVHHVLHDAVSGICRSPHHDSGQRRLRAAAAFSLGRIDDDGRDRLAAAGTGRARLSQARLLGPRRRHRTVQSGSSGEARSAAADLHDHGPRRGRKESRSVSVARSARHQSRRRRRAAAGAARAEISGRGVPRREKGRGPDRASRRRRCLRVSEPHRHLWRGAARGAGLRHAGRGVPGHRPEGRHCRSSDRRAGQRSAQRLPARADDVARDLPQFRAGAFLGKQRPAIHRQSGRVAAEPRAAARAQGRRAAAPFRVDYQTSQITETRRQTHHGRNHQARRHAVAGLRPRDGRAGLRPLGAGVRPRVRRRVQARAARPRSRPPTRSAAACSKSASAPASRCRNMRRICASSAPTFRKRCWRRPRSASPNSA